MAVEIQAQGLVGIAFETTWGTYVAPTKYFPVRSCDLNYSQETQWRRPIRGLADNIDGVPGFSTVTGTIEMELMENILPYFLYVSRNTVVKTGATNFVYTATPAHFGTSASLPTGKKGLSISVQKAGMTFGYTGCVVTGIEFGVDGATPIVTFTIIGNDEATQSALTYVEDATSLVYGAGMWNIQVPTASQIYDVDNMSITIDEGAEAQHRLSDRRRAEFIKFGERTITAQLDRDFSTRTEYDAFKILTTTSVKVSCIRSVNNGVDVTLPRAVPETYEPGVLSSQGDLVRASVQYQGTYNSGTSKAGEIVVRTQQDIT